MATQQLADEAREHTGHCSACWGRGNSCANVPGRLSPMTDSLGAGRHSLPTSYCPPRQEVKAVGIVLQCQSQCSGPEKRRLSRNPPAPFYTLSVHYTMPWCARCFAASRSVACTGEQPGTTTLRSHIQFDKGHEGGREHRTHESGHHADPCCSFANREGTLGGC